MELDTIIHATQSAVARNDWKTASGIANALPYPDIASVLGHLSAEAALQLLRRCQYDKQSIIFGYMAPRIQSEMAQLMSRSELTALFEKMEHDERADPYFLGISMVSSTRRFCARPSAVSFDCKGRVSAYPTARRRALSIPFASK